MSPSVLLTNIYWGFFSLGNGWIMGVIFRYNDIEYIKSFSLFYYLIFLAVLQFQNYISYPTSFTLHCIYNACKINLIYMYNTSHST
jgi:hypothetical protein